MKVIPNIGSLQFYLKEGFRKEERLVEIMALRVRYGVRLTEVWEEDGAPRLLLCSNQLILISPVKHGGMRPNSPFSV